jgi:CRISPR-associated exonuclease Cas4
METGKELQNTARQRLLELLEQRHELVEILWEYPVESKRLRLRGRADLVATTAQDTAIVAEIKLQPITRRSLRARNKHVAIQLTAYAIAAEETLHKPVTTTYIYSIEAQTLTQLTPTPQLRSLVEKAANNLHKAITQNKEPAPTPSRKHCTTCEYNTICPYSATQRQTSNY